MIMIQTNLPEVDMESVKMLSLDEQIERAHEIITAILKKDIGGVLRMVETYHKTSIYHSFAGTLLLVLRYVARQDNNLTDTTEETVRELRATIQSQRIKNRFYLLPPLLSILKITINTQMSSVLLH